MVEALALWSESVMEGEVDILVAEFIAQFVEEVLALAFLKFSVVQLDGRSAFLLRVWCNTDLR